MLHLIAEDCAPHEVPPLGGLPRITMRTNPRMNRTLIATLITLTLLTPPVVAAGGNPCFGVVTAPKGCEAWTNRYNGPGLGKDVVLGMVVSADNARVYFTGESLGSGTGKDYAPRAIDAGTGSTLWTALYTTGGAVDDNAQGIAVSPDSSRIVVVGTSGTLAYDSAGIQVWTDSAPTLSAAFATQSSCTVYVSGSSTTKALNASTGAAIWTASFGGWVNLTADGNHVIAAKTSTVKSYNASTGSLEWTATFGGPAPPRLPFPFSHCLSGSRRKRPLILTPLLVGNLGFFRPCHAPRQCNYT